MPDVRCGIVSLLCLPYTARGRRTSGKSHYGDTFKGDLGWLWLAE